VRCIIEELASVFRCDDQSALINNFVASDDPPPGAWSHHSAPQSPLGRVMFPGTIGSQLVTIAQGQVYTRGTRGQLVEHALTRREWLPWSLTGTNDRIRIERTVTRDVWLARVRVIGGSAGLLVFEVRTGANIRFERCREGLRFLWGRRCRVELRAAPVWLSDDPGPLKRKFAGFDDVKLTDEHCRWIGVPFRGRIEVRFAVGRVRPISFAAARRAEQGRWERFFSDQVPPLYTDDPVVRDTYYFAWQTIWANRCDGGAGLTRRPFTSPSRLGYGSQWFWDEAFHAVVFRHLKNSRLAFEGFENFWRAQRADGAIPGCLRFESTETPMAMQPPVIGLALQLLRDKPGWPKNMPSIHTALRRWARWLLSRERDTDRDGLAEYHHCFDGPSDQSPRWDSQKLDPAKVIDRLRPTESVDLNVWLSVLWEVLGETARARHMFEQVEALMWDDRDGFYYDIDGRTHRKIPVKTPFGFMPLLSPFMRGDRAERLVREHLLNPREFWCRYPLPSVSLDHPAFDPINRFRGPTWVNVNWMVIEGLHRQGFPREAVRLARKTVELVGPRYRQGRRVRSPRLWEWYHPHTGEALGNNQYSWSALVVDLILRFLVDEKN